MHVIMLESISGIVIMAIMEKVKICFRYIQTVPMGASLCDRLKSVLPQTRP